MKTRFTVTDRAGTYVAGRRAKAGDVLELTEDEARLDVAGGALVAEGAELHPMFGGASAKSDGIRAAARGATALPLSEAAPTAPAKRGRR